MAISIPEQAGYKFIAKREAVGQGRASESTGAGTARACLCIAVAHILAAIKVGYGGTASRVNDAIAHCPVWYSGQRRLLMRQALRSYSARSDARLL